MRRFIWTKGVWKWVRDHYVLIERQGFDYDGPMALCMDDPTFAQDSIQVFNDDGTDETDSTAKAGVGVNITDQALDENLLIRFLLKETAGNQGSNKSARLEVRLNEGTYGLVSGGTLVARSFASTKLTEGNDTTQRIGSGTFVTPNAGQDDINGVAGSSVCDFAGNDETEFVYCVQILSADVNAGENVDFRMSDSDIDVYTDPEIKVTIASNGDVTLTGDPGSLVLSGATAALGLGLLSASGSLTLTGAEATLTLSDNTVLTGDPGSLVLTGAEATLVAGGNVILTGDPGSLVLTGADAALGLGLASNPGSLVLSGAVATLTLSDNVVLIGDAGSLVLTGADADLVESAPPLVVRRGGVRWLLEPDPEKREEKLKELTGLLKPAISAARPPQAPAAPLPSIISHAVSELPARQQTRVDRLLQQTGVSLEELLIILS